MGENSKLLELYGKLEDIYQSQNVITTKLAVIESQMINAERVFKQSQSNTELIIQLQANYANVKEELIRNQKDIEDIEKEIRNLKDSIANRDRAILITLFTVGLGAVGTLLVNQVI